MFEVEAYCCVCPTHLSSKAANRRASRMFSSGSQVLYLAGHEAETCLTPHMTRGHEAHTHLHAHFNENNLAVCCAAITDCVAASGA